MDTNTLSRIPSMVFIKVFFWCLFLTRRPKSSRFPGKDEIPLAPGLNIHGFHPNVLCRFSLVPCPTQHISTLCAVSLPFYFPTNECRSRWCTYRRPFLHLSASLVSGIHIDRRIDRPVTGGQLCLGTIPPMRAA